MSGVAINVGNKKYGYKAVYPLSNGTKEIIQHYIDNVAKGYEDIPLIENNVKIAKDILSGKRIDMKKWGPVIAGSVSFITAFLIFSSDPVSASTLIPSGTSIDLTPVDNIVSEVYWAMFKLSTILLLPVYAWVGYTLLFAGASVAKRTLAKSIASWSTIGIGAIAGAPWLIKTVTSLWEKYLMVV